MDFSNDVFRVPVSSSRVSEDTISHANLVRSCQWGWTSTQDPNGTRAQPSAASLQTATPTFNNVRSKRFASCQGRIYHQLICGHRIRTDVVEDCGATCLEPLGPEVGLAFLCGQCLEAEASKIWTEREAQHNAMYPSMDQMTKELYDRWYEEHRQLEAEYARDRKAYELGLKSNTRPSNICSAIEVTKEEAEFAMELDSLSLSLSNSGTSPKYSHPEQAARARIALPSDASEQLHWNLNSLTLDRGSCGVEYIGSSPPNNVRHASQKTFWGTPRG